MIIESRRRKCSNKDARYYNYIVDLFNGPFTGVSHASFYDTKLRDTLLTSLLLPADLVGANDIARARNSVGSLP